jgi:hypothetical protein
MAKTKTKDKSKTKGKSNFKVRGVRNKEDRRRPSVFMRLKTDEYFKGIALFEPDPELKDNPGYYEYYDHYDKQANQYVPCAGDKCPFCAANDNPSTRAITVWYFPENDAKDQIKLFTLNYGTINDITDEAEDEDGILGKKIRIKRLSDKGDYKVKVTSDKALSKTDIKKAMKLLEEKFEDGLEAVVEKQLVAQMERLKAMEALEDDDEDDEDEVEEEDDDEEEEESDDDDDDEEEEESDDDDDDEEEEEEEESDDDDDDEEEEEEEGGEDDIVGTEYVIKKVNEKDEIFDLEGEDGKVKMWLGEGVDVDYDEAKVGATISVNASQDDEGDWIITELAVTKKAKKESKPKGGKSTTKDKGKGGKKGGKGKK